ncbi:hypothetical protein J6590_088277, partial [Homalodisca vitripennis]
MRREYANGDVNKTCLRRTCGASFRTDSTKTKLVAICNEKHSGDHSVTTRTLSPIPLITSPATIARPKTYLKTKVELVDRISELTSRQAGLVDKIQELTRQLEDAKVELNRHRVVNVQALAKSSVFKCDSSIQTEFISSDKSLQRENRKQKKLIYIIRKMKEGVVAAKYCPTKKRMSSSHQTYRGEQEKERTIQCGFRKHVPKIDATNKLMDLMVEGLDKRAYSLSVFLHLFSWVHHATLL